MKNKIYRFIAAASVLAGLLFPAGNLSAVEQPVVILYGSEACGLCKAMKRNLDAESIKYTFFDVKTDKEKSSEMWKKIYSAYPARKGGVRFPVMDINGSVLISPKFEEVKSMLGSDQIKNELDTSSLENTDKETGTVLIYGSEACGLCKAMKRNLDAESIKYTFFDVKTDKEKSSEMWKKIYSAYPGRKGGVRFPVMEINGSVLISPKFEEVKSKLSSDKSENE